ncbi:hypothetical protein GCM10007276_11270 [Agaricicola taiwanensis]|uniref:Uncharacterized protein n=1 Tax=Agaricicola taiwanensis TaxID=591372 RepID=A0A8J2YDZ5_9RHOB|nr:hypothetical protein [Agaricicola taiwanensis]GGE35574.1 hypothetical protein GCM10007276_11270 [Agaricicola taiwanensis]
MPSQGNFAYFIIGGLLVAVGVLAYLFYENSPKQQGVEIKVNPAISTPGS